MQEGESLLQKIWGAVAGSPLGLRCNFLLGGCRLFRGRLRFFDDRGLRLLLGRFLRLRRSESSFGLCEKIEVTFARDVRMPGEHETERKPGQLLIGQSGDGGRQNLLRRLLVVLVAADVEFRHVLGEVVWVKVDEGAKKHPQLRCGEREGGVRKDALEGGDAGLALFLAAGLLGFVLLLLPLELGFALLLFAFLFGLVLGHALLMPGLTLRRLFLGFLFGRGGDGGRRVGGALCRDVGVMHRAIGIRANGDGFSDVPAKDDDGGFGVGAWRLGVRVVGGIELAVLMFLQRTGTLLFRVAPRCLKLHKLRPCGKLPVDVGGGLHLVAGRVKALVALHIVKETGVESAAAGAGDASSGCGVKGGVLAVERSIREIEVEVGLYPRAQVLGGKQVRLFVLPVLAPALLEGRRLVLLRQTGKQVGMTGGNALLDERFGNVGNELQKRETRIDVAGALAGLLNEGGHVVTGQV